MEKYKEIDFVIGSNIESAINKLELYKSKGELVYGVFNGQNLYSDTDTLDSAYLKITGKTRKQNDEDDEKRNEEYEKSKQKHKDDIPELTKQWIENGNIILDENYRQKWAECVPIRLDDLYKGMELKACLDIIIELNNGCSLDEAKSIIEGQGHSGMSFGLVCSMVRSFCNRGEEFYNYVRL